MACKCQKPCGRDICCSVCSDVDDCKDRCATCAPKKHESSKEEPDTKKED